MTHRLLFLFFVSSFFFSPASCASFEGAIESLLEVSPGELLLHCRQFDAHFPRIETEERNHERKPPPFDHPSSNSSSNASTPLTLSIRFFQSSFCQFLSSFSFSQEELSQLTFFVQIAQRGDYRNQKWKQAEQNKDSNESKDSNEERPPSLETAGPVPELPVVPGPFDHFPSPNRPFNEEVRTLLDVRENKKLEQRGLKGQRATTANCTLWQMFYDHPIWIQTNLSTILNDTSVTCYLTGVIPTEIGLVQGLTSLWMGGSILGGSLPTEIGLLTNLKTLTTSNTRLSSSIPSEIGLITGLVELTLSQSQFSSTILTQIGVLKNLKILNLATNQLASTLPTQIGLLRNLETLKLNTNQFSSPVPSEIGLVRALKTLDLSNNPISSPIPSQIFLLTNLTILNFRSCQLSSTIMTQIGLLKNLANLDLSSNQLSSYIPSELGLLNNLKVWDFRNNQLSGTIPTTIGLLSNLTNILCDNNQLSSSIPTEIGLLKNLVVVTLPFNQLSSLPSEIGFLTAAIELTLTSNQLSSSIPTEIGLMSNLQILGLGSNQFSSSIPSQIGLLTKLKTLSLSSNQLVSSVPSQIGLLTKLSDSLDLSSNQLSYIPSEIGNLSLLMKMVLSFNQISTLPSEIGQLTSLIELYLSKNLLSELPQQMGKLSKLTTLTLRLNKFQKVPSSVTQLLQSALISLDFSSNNLTLVDFQPFYKSFSVMKFLDVSSCNIQRIIFSTQSSGSGLIVGFYYPPEEINLSNNPLKLVVGSPTATSADQFMNSFILQSKRAYVNNCQIRGIFPTKSSPIEILSIDENNFSGTIPSWISQMKSFSGSKNQFSSLDKRLFRDAAMRLSFLDLSLNQINQSIEYLFHKNDAFLTPSWVDLSSNFLHGDLNSTIFFQPSEATAVSLSQNNPGMNCVGLPEWCAGPEWNGTEDCWPCDAVCGDGIVVSEKEQCDDGNTQDNDGCSSKCQIEQFYTCKNSYSTSSGTLIPSPSKCTIPRDCVGLPAFCAGKEWNGTEACWPCTTTCGDGIVVRALGEECDDGNTVNNDGCSSRCIKENGFDCENFYFVSNLRVAYSPSKCSPSSSNNNSSDVKIVLAIVIPISVVVILVMAFILWRFYQRTTFLEYYEKQFKIQSNYFIINEEDLAFQRIIGEGNFGNVYAGILRATTKVAIKEFKVKSSTAEKTEGSVNTTSTLKEEYTPSNELNNFLSEAKLMCNLPPHPNTVLLLGICISESKKTIYIITEYVRKGSLQVYLRRHQNNLSAPILVKLCHGVAAGMQHLAHFSIIHNDLAARNVLVDEVTPLDEEQFDVIAKVTDFGLASQRQRTNQDSIRRVIPVRWTAPEVLLGKSPPSQRSDVWSFGVLMYEVFHFCTQLPYDGLKIDDIPDYLLEQKMRLERPNACPEEMYAVMLSCWAENPESRPTFQQLCSTIQRGLPNDPVNTATTTTEYNNNTATSTYNTTFTPRNRPDSADKRDGFQAIDGKEGVYDKETSIYFKSIN